ncbi:MAG: N-acetylmuramoyl-L-alanine amidase, partial [Oscillospiraceae bacterium]|nr:N-acetylmuramoyl-L-alanine amidase [Oscillospiraceae bacterium]
LLLILILCIARSCSKQKEPEPAATSVIDPVETEPVTEAKKDNSKAVFLSPSNDAEKVFACDESVTEKSAMADLADAVRILLETDGYTVYISDPEDNVKDKVTKGNELGCGAYVALHTYESDVPGSETGPQVTCNDAVTGSRALAENIYNRINELTEEDGNGFIQRERYEIMNNRYPCCSIEIDAHDNYETSQWMLDNKDALAKAIKNGITAYLNAAESGYSSSDESEGADVAGDGADVAGEGADVAGEGADVAGEGADVAGEGADVAGEGAGGEAE